MIHPVDPIRVDVDAVRCQIVVYCSGGLAIVRSPGRIVLICNEEHTLVADELRASMR